MRLLLVEDDQKIGAFVEKGLRQEGHAVDWVRDGDESVAVWQATAYDAAIVDIMLPGLGGLDVIRAVRRKRIATPIIILSARDAVADRVEGLESGADDYLTKPFSFAELVARVNALTRRATAAGAGETRLSYGGVTLDLLTRQVTRDGASLSLQAKELALLEYLLRNPERVLSKTMILQRLWDYSFDPQTNVVDVLVCRLRNKIDRDFPDKLIQTLRGVGYVLRKK
ncbi:MAG TPA: response regulator transcription factor [Polyangia bacterium]|jgi:DNA-binding response OmpR family regulator|nr:response regulator transcription factor [Polyangia bacterium]